MNDEWHILHIKWVGSGKENGGREGGRLGKRGQICGDVKKIINK